MEELQPWIFTRNELDLLEEALERLVMYHDESRGRAWFPFEETIIGEHLLSEEEESARTILDLPLFAEQRRPPTLTVEEWEKEPLLVQLRDQRIEHPLFLAARALFEPIAAWCEQRYVSDTQKDRRLFTLWLNITLLPIKVALGTQAHDPNDAVTARWCLTEIRLALIYLGRAMNALADLHKTREAPLSTTTFLAHARQLEQALIHRQRPTKAL